MASEFEILAYDQRGLGQTTIPDGPYTMQDYAEDADALSTAFGVTDARAIADLCAALPGIGCLARDTDETLHRFGALPATLAAGP